MSPRIWQPRWLKWSVAISRKGALTRDGIPTTQALTEDVAASLPGAPMAIPTPGHTGGHCSFVVDGVLVSGDALVTGHPLLPRTGPAAAAEVFNHDQDGCVRSLAALAMLETEVLLPGHGAGVARPDPRGRRAAQADRSVRSRAGTSRSGTARSTHEGRHQDLVVEFGVVRRAPRDAGREMRPQPESGGQESQPARGKEQPPNGRLRNAPHHTPGRSVRQLRASL